MAEHPKTYRSRASGFTLLEVMVSSSIVLMAFTSFLGAVHLCAQGTGFHSVVSQQVRETESKLDDMLIGMRWISVNDPTLKSTYPVGQTASIPMVTFRRINGTDSAGNFTWGDKITYYWLPSPRENSKYATGDMSLWSAADVDGKDYDYNSMYNDGVIWRKIEDANGDGKLDSLGYETFPNETTDLRVVMTNVPAPFGRVGGYIVPTDSFRIDVDTNAHTVTLVLKRFVNTGVPVSVDMEPRPSTVPVSTSVVDSTKGTVTVLTVQRTYCVRN